MPVLIISPLFASADELEGNAIEREKITGASEHPKGFLINFNSDLLRSCHSDDLNTFNAESVSLQHFFS